MVYHYKGKSKGLSEEKYYKRLMIVVLDVCVLRFSKDSDIKGKGETTKKS